MSPFIRSFQDNMSNWVNTLIHQQDGCLQAVAQQATQGRLRQEQLAQTVARCAAMTITTRSGTIPTCATRFIDEEADLNKSVQIRDNHFIQEKEALAQYASTQQA